MFRASMCPSSGENCCVCATLVDWLIDWLLWARQLMPRMHRSLLAYCATPNTVFSKGSATLWFLCPYLPQTVHNEVSDFHMRLYKAQIPWHFLLAHTDVNKPTFVFYIFVNKGIIIVVITNSVALVRERTIQTERPPPVGEVSANFCG